MIVVQRCVGIILLIGIYFIQIHVLSVEIECLPLEQCPFATKILAKARHSKVAFEFLNSTKCGVEEGTNKTKVWCSRIINCATPDFRKGSCIRASNCEELNSLLENNTDIQNVQNIINEYRCHIPAETELRVCCPVSNSLKPKSTLQFSERRRKKRSWNGYGDRSFFNDHGHNHRFYNHFHNHYIPNRYNGDHFGEEDNFNEYHFEMQKFNENRPEWFHKILLNNSEHSSSGSQQANNPVLEWWNGKKFGNEGVENSNQYNITEESSSGKEICQTPENLDGNCKEIHHCSTILDVLKTVNITNREQVAYLRKFKCPSAIPTDIRICCPESAVILPNISSVSITPKTQNNREQNISLVPDSSSCGRQIIDDKITGGTTAGLAEFPWAALLRYTRSKDRVYGCGGTIISKRYILTAAHCVNTTVLEKNGFQKIDKIILGEYDTRNETDCIYTRYGTDCADPRQFFEVEQIVEHEQFNSASAIHDIALIRVNKDITFSNYIMPICLPDKKTFSLLGNETFFITGWGVTDTGRASPVKLKARLPVVDKTNCNQIDPLNNGQICLGDGKGADSCKGDSGGPVMHTVPISGDLVTTLVGIISYGFGQCGIAPSVNTYVPFYLDWIMTHIS